MTTGDVVSIGTVAGATVAAFLKGLPAVIRALSTARREADRVRKSAEEQAAKAKAEAETERELELAEMRSKLQSYANREHACEIKLTRALAWLAHLEAALTEAGIKYIPYNETGRADSDVPKSHSDTPQPTNRQKPPKR